MVDAIIFLVSKPEIASQTLSSHPLLHMRTLSHSFCLSLSSWCTYALTHSKTSMRKLPLCLILRLILTFPHWTDQNMRRCGYVVSRATCLSMILVRFPKNWGKQVRRWFATFRKRNNLSQQTQNGHKSRHSSLSQDWRRMANALLGNRTRDPVLRKQDL